MFLSLRKLDPVVQEAVLALGETLPKNSISYRMLSQIVKLPKKEQILRLKQFIEEADMEVPKQLM